MDVLGVRGSYAGGLSAYPNSCPAVIGGKRQYFDNDGKVDLSGSPADAIGSVANYLKSFGWEAGPAAASQPW